MSESEVPITVTKRSWLSLAAVLFVQTQNAFNDNFVKFVLMGLAMAAAAGTTIGDNIEFILAAMIPLPFILFAPVAGYLSDRYSKRDVICNCLLLQLALFILIGISVALRSVQVAVFGFFLLAVQSTLFSPAKQGILKEIVGSAKLGFANGLLSMLTMVGILAGMWLAGQWFDSGLARYNAEFGEGSDNAWRAALIPVIGAGVACLVAIVIGRMISKTPAHPDEEFTPAVWVRHFRHLKQLFSYPLLRYTALFITFYWFVANFLGLGFVQFAKEIFPDAGRAGRMSATAEMLFWVGGGLMIGSVIVSLLSLLFSSLSRGKGQLYLSPLGGIGMAIGLAGAGLFDPSGIAWKFSLGFVGFSSGFYVVPLNAWLQDLAEDDHRARVISALNLMTAFSGIVAILIGLVLKQLGLNASQQVLLFAFPMVAVSLALIFLLRSSASDS